MSIPWSRIFGAVSKSARREHFDSARSALPLARDVAPSISWLGGRTLSHKGLAEIAERGDWRELRLAIGIQTAAEKSALSQRERNEGLAWLASQDQSCPVDMLWLSISSGADPFHDLPGRGGLARARMFGMPDREREGALSEKEPRLGASIARAMAAGGAWGDLALFSSWAKSTRPSAWGSLCQEEALVAFVVAAGALRLALRPGEGAAAAKALEALVRSGASVEKESSEGVQPLHIACGETAWRRGLVLDRGWDNPAHRTVSLDLAKALVALGAPLDNPRGKYMLTPILSAALSASAEIIAMLGANGAMLDERSADGDGAAHLVAAFVGSRSKPPSRANEAFLAVMDLGVDVRGLNARGKSSRDEYVASRLHYSVSSRSEDQHLRRAPSGAMLTVTELSSIFELEFDSLSSLREKKMLGFDLCEAPSGQKSRL